MRELHLFAGAGGGILGGILLGHTCVCAVEIESYRRQSMLQRQRDGVFPRFPIWDDVRTFDGKPWNGLVDVVCGGFPCQDISPSGNLKGIDGPKSGLWREMARIIREIQPKHVFVENSSMLLIRGLDRVLGDLAKMGYDAKWGVLGAVDAIWLEGTPVFDHERLRCFIKASHSNCLRKLQSQRSVSDKRGWIGNSPSAPANANGSRRTMQASTKAAAFHGKRNASPFESARRRVSMPVATANNGWWANEPGVGRVVHGMANRIHRIAAIGDGQVPAVAALAWKTLSGE